MKPQPPAWLVLLAGRHQFIRDYPPFQKKYQGLPGPSATTELYTGAQDNAFAVFRTQLQLCTNMQQISDTDADKLLSEAHVSMTESYTPSAKGLSFTIIHTKDMTVPALRTMYDDSNSPCYRKTIIFVDNDPVKSGNRTPYTISNRNAWLVVLDHHGVFDDRDERTAFDKVIETLPILDKRGLLDPRNAIAVTNHGNLDPDGIYSLFALVKPTLAQKYYKQLSAADHFTDFAMFGGYLFDKNFEMLDDAQELSFIVLQLIMAGKMRFVRKGTSLFQLTPQQTEQIFKMILNALPKILSNTAAHRRLGRQYLARLKNVFRNANRVATPHNGDLMTIIDLKGKRPLDKSEAADWLAEGAAKFTTDHPLLILRNPSGTYAIAAKYDYPDKREYQIDLNPLIEYLRKNDVQESAWFGREGIALNFGRTKFEPKEIANIILELNKTKKIIQQL